MKLFSAFSAEFLSELSDQNLLIAEHAEDSREVARKTSGVGRIAPGCCLQLDFQPFGGRAYFGIVIARVGHDFIDDGITMVGIVMVED
jgi:hypothetical protein